MRTGMRQARALLARLASRDLYVDVGSLQIELDNDDSVRILRPTSHTLHLKPREFVLNPKP